MGRSGHNVGWGTCGGDKTPGPQVLPGLSPLPHAFSHRHFAGREGALTSGLMRMVILTCSIPPGQPCDLKQSLPCPGPWPPGLLRGANATGLLGLLGECQSVENQASRECGCFIPGTIP